MMIIGFLWALFLGSISTVSIQYEISKIYGSPKVIGESYMTSKFIVAPKAIAFDSNGSLHIADIYSYSVFKENRKQRTVDVLIGNGIQGFREGSGENAQLFRPCSMAFRSNGDLFITDRDTHLILKVTPKGLMIKYSGTLGQCGGSDGDITQARFCKPTGIVSDNDDNLYILESDSDTDHGNRVRKITKRGIVTTIAGSYISGFLDGQGIEARFNAPEGIALDSKGNLVISDTRNNALRILNSTGYVSTIAGGPDQGYVDGGFDIAKFSDPKGLAIDENGDILVVDVLNNVVRKLSMSTKTVQTIIGNTYGGFYDGLGKDAQLNRPLDIKLGPDGTFYIAEEVNSAIRNFNPKSTIVSTYIRLERQRYQDGFGSDALFHLPSHLTTDNSGFVYVSDTSNNVIRKVSRDGFVTTYAGFGGVSGYQDGDGNKALFNSPTGISFDNMGNLYVADTSNNAIRVICPNGTVTTLSGSGMMGKQDGYGRSASFNHPRGLTYQKSTGMLFVTDTDNHLIRRVNPNTSFVETWAGTGDRVYRNGPRLTAGLNVPIGICADPFGNIWFTDHFNAVRKISPDGVVSWLAGDIYQQGAKDGSAYDAKFRFPEALACDNLGNLYSADYYNSAIRKITTKGDVKTLAGAYIHGTRDGTGTLSQLKWAMGVTVNDEGLVYAGDTYNCAIRSINQTTLRLKFIAGLGTTNLFLNATRTENLRNAFGLAVHPVTNELYVADTDHNLILTVAKSQMQIFAGQGNNGWYNSQLGLRDSQFYYPYSITFTRNGTLLFVADTFNHLIRVIDMISGKVGTFAGIGWPDNKIGTVSLAAFNHPKDVVCAANGDLYVSDTKNNVIKKIARNFVTIVVGNGNAGMTNGRGSSAQLNQPFGLTFGENETSLFISDYQNHAIRRYNLKTDMLTTVAGNGDPGHHDSTGNQSTFNNPTGLAFNAKRKELLVADLGNDALRMISFLSDNTVKVSTISNPKDLPLRRPSNVIFTNDDEIIVLSSGDGSLMRIVYPKTQSSTSLIQVSDMTFTLSIISVSAIIILLTASSISMYLKYKRLGTLSDSKTIRIKNLSAAGPADSSRLKDFVKMSGPIPSNIDRLIYFSQRNSLSIEASRTIDISRSGKILIY